GVSGSEPQFGAKIMPWSLSPPMIVDPPDRRIPYQPWAASIGRVGENYYKYLDPRTGCAQAGVPRVVQQDPNQILQPPTDDYILWLFEDHHMQRVINMNQRPPLGDSIKLYNGYSRGHWDGNTLVIDVTNLNGYDWLDDAGNFHTDAAHIVERLTLFDPDTIHYQVTLEDPALPGSPQNTLDFDAILNWVLTDADALAGGEIHGMILENFGDVPFYPQRVPPHTVAFMTALGREIRRRFNLPLGINVLRNDARAALAVAAAVD